VNPRHLHRALLALLLCLCGTAAADEIRVAVASNFSETLQVIAARFEQASGHRVILLTGSTGKHYAQIRNGAPFDLFFAADAARPQRLEAEGAAVSGSRFTYAEGRLLLWSPDPDLVDAEAAVLRSGSFRHLAIANPKLAPYGKAAREVLTAMGLWDALQDRMVRGENIGQTFQFVASGNAELGFVAASQVLRPGQGVPGSLWEVPRALYSPIEQQAVLLRDSPAGRALLAFLRSGEIRELIRRSGYDTP
jgi:molybdate transport system substrate-binding protein